MFIYGNIEQGNHAQHQGRLRRVEREQLIRQVEIANGIPGLWQWTGGVVLNVMHKIMPASHKQQASSPPRLTEKIA